MKLELITEELDRLGYIEEDKELSKFYYKKLEEFDIKTPDELEDIKDFFEEICEEWVEELVIDDMIDTYNIILESYDDAEKINTNFLYKFITEKFKKVIRDGKIKKKKICKDGYVLKDGKCKKQKASDRKKRSKGAKRGARKKKGQKSAIARKRKKSMKKSKLLGN